MLSVSVDPATNRVVGRSYDANGNDLVDVYTVYDVENRMITGSAGTYVYDHAGKRVKEGDETSWEYYFYGVGGQKLVTEACTAAGCGAPQYNVYFGGKLVQSKGVVVVTDRLGSVRANTAGEQMRYYPYGEERTSTADGREKFGTYTRDNATTDYADQRYYGVGAGRFGTADPGGIWTADPAAPGTWNRYAYGNNDPANSNDPEGLSSEDGPPTGCIINGMWWGDAICMMMRPGRGSGGVLRNDPAPFTKSQVHDIAEFLQYAVTQGGSDCEALADFSDTMASGSESDNQFIRDFGVLTPAGLAANVSGIATSGKTDLVYLNTGQASGFANVYQNTVPDGRANDPSWNGDQGHHFAAFLQWGYNHPLLGATAAYSYEQLQAVFGFNGPVNEGDINLGMVAAKWGSDLKAGTISRSELGEKIQDGLCK